MKLKHRISAALTALALIFTLFDSSALGSIINAAGRAFAGSLGELTHIEFNKGWKPEPPVPGDEGSFWTVNQNNTTLPDAISQVDVKWFCADDPNKLQPAGNKPQYNTVYKVEINFTVRTDNYEIPLDKVLNDTFRVYYWESNQTYDFDVEITANSSGVYQNVIASMVFDRTVLPKPTFAEFNDTDMGVIGGDTLEKGKVTSFRKGTSKQAIAAALPKYAVIHTEDYVINSIQSIYEINGVEINWLVKNNDGTYSFNYKKGSYDENKVDAQEFTIIGYATLPNNLQNKLNYVGITLADWPKYPFYATININEAEKLDPPVVSSKDKPGKYNQSMTIQLSAENEAEIYYTINEEEPGDTPIPNVETETNKKYDSAIGIPLAGEPGKSVTYYIRAIAFHKSFLTSEPAEFSYTITREPSSMKNIDSVEIKVTPPVGGELLNTKAELADDTGISTISSVSWTGNISSGKAWYNERYSISLVLTPANKYAFFSTAVTVNGKEAKGTTNADGSLTVTYTFPGKTDKLSLDKCTIVDPSGIIAVKNGTSMSDISAELPKTVELEVPTGNLLEEEFAVTWDLSSVKYDPKQAAEQQFKITGKVELPGYISYEPNTNLTYANVYVGEAGTLVWPTAWPLDSSGASGDRTFGDKVEVTLKAEENAAIYYNIGYELGYIDDSDDSVANPSKEGGTGYTNPIVLEGIPGEIVTYTIKAIAMAPGMKDSPVNTFKYTLVIPKLTSAAPTTNQPVGEYSKILDISLNTTTVGAKIYYTLNDFDKPEDFKEYTAPIRLEGQANSTKIYNVRCYAADPEKKMFDSAVMTYSYVISLPKDKAMAPYPDKTYGISYEDSLTVSLQCDTKTKTEIYYTIDTPLQPDKGINGKLYTSGFKLKKKANDIVTYTVRTYAKSLDPNVDSSDVVEYTFTIGIDYGVKSIEIEKRPLKYSYYLGELLNVTGGKIKVNYEDGTTESVAMTDEMIDDFDSWVLGQQAITVSYKGCTTEFNIVVRKKDNSTTDTNPSDKDDTNKPADTGKDTETNTDTDQDKDTSGSDEETVSPPTMKGSAVKGWEQLQLKIKSAEIGSRVVIYLNGTTSVPADIINTAAKRKATLEFVVNDMISWVIDAGAISKTVSSVSVGLRSKDVYIPSVLIDSAGDTEVVRMHVYGENKVGAMLYVKTGCKEKSRFVNLYRYNDESHKLDFVSTSKVAISTGLAQVKPASDGDYVLMLDIKTKLPGDADNSTIVDARDSAAILKMMVGLMEIDDTCDFNGDGFINALDAAAILRSVVGLK